MNLLGAKLYDPGSAVTKATSSLLAMTALDTTNLRINFTVPSHGMVRVRIECVVHGGSGPPSVLLGVMDGASVVGRVAPMHMTLISATARLKYIADFVIPGLTPGSVSWDAAYGVEITVASSAIKYGGPDDTTTDNAYGAFSFEVWDPQPINTAGQLSVDSNGRVDVIKVAGTTQTAGDLATNIAAVQADLPQRITQNVALASFPFFMADSSDHVTGKAGLTVTAQRSLDGAAFGACANAVAEIGNGWYKISFDATDMNAKTVALKFTATGADPTNLTIVTEPT